MRAYLTACVLQLVAQRLELPLNLRSDTESMVREGGMGARAGQCRKTRSALGGT